jgi:hypothetical protein
MHAPMSELEELTNACAKIWNAWDDEGDKIQQIFRDLAKKQRNSSADPGKFIYRINYRHKELEKRIEELSKFRFEKANI